MYYATFDNRKLNNFTLEEWETLPFKNIKTISFDNNQLTKLPHLNKLINLKYLYCVSNYPTNL